MRQRQYSRSFDGFTLIELLVVMAIIGVMILLLLPAIQKVRETANWTVCGNNLKQVGLATFHFADEHKGRFPAKADGVPLGEPVPQSFLFAGNGFFTALLPYLEQSALCQELVQYATATGNGSNQAQVVALFNTFNSIAGKPLPVAVCPSTLPAPFLVYDRANNGAAAYFGYSGGYPWLTGTTAWGGMSYAASNALEGADFTTPAGLRTSQMRDGTSNTIWLGEFKLNTPINWNYLTSNQAYDYNGTLITTLWQKFAGSTSYQIATGGIWAIGPAVARPEYPLNDPNYGADLIGGSPGNGIVMVNVGFPIQIAFENAYGSNHPGGANFLFCDGSVHFLHNGINNTPYLLLYLSTAQGGEVINVDF